MTCLEDWLGREQVREGVIDQATTKRMAITLDAPVPGKGDPLPPCWHWAWFNDELGQKELGRDGHPRRGGFLPPVPLPRRMWAGGEIVTHTPLMVGETVRKISTIEKIAHKTGTSGKFVVVSVCHKLYQGEELAIDERQDLVFREDPKPDQPKPTHKSCPQGAELSSPFTPNTVLMFRYSALTFNGHRIHYDADYARQMEGYPDLVFHAPLSATLLHQLASHMLKPASPASRFQYRALAPLFVHETFFLKGKAEGSGEIKTWICAPAGHMAFEAWLTLGN